MLLDRPFVVLVSSNGRTERPLSLLELAQMLRMRQVTATDQVFATPPLLDGTTKAFVTTRKARMIDDLVDMDSVEQMSGDDVEELAFALWEQLTPKELVTEAEAILTERATAQNGGVRADLGDELTRACVEIAPPLDLRCSGFLRGPVDLLPTLADAAARELGETQATRTTALAQLRRKMQVLERDGMPGGSPGIGRAITFGRTDDEFLVAFLRAKKFVVADALSAIVRYARFVEENAEWLAETESLLGDEARLASQLGIYVAPGTTQSGRRVLLLKWSQVSEALLRRVEPERHSVPLFQLIVRLVLGLFGRLLSDSHAQVLGVTLIQDWEDPPPMALVMRINSTLTYAQKRTLLGLLREVLPLRQSGLFALNQPAWLTIMMAARTNKKKALVPGGWFPYLPERISYEQLHSMVSPADLPVAFRGFQALRPTPDPEDQELHVQELQKQIRLFTDLLREVDDIPLRAKLVAIQTELARIMLARSEDDQCKRGMALEEIGVPAGRIALSTHARSDAEQPCALQ